MKTAIKITGFIPNPEMAATVVAWTFSLAGPDDEIEFLCYEKKISEQTQFSVKELLKGSEKEILVKGMYDPMVVKAVVEESRKNKSQLLVISEFSYQEVDGVAQNAEALVQAAPCKTFLAWGGDKKPDDIKRILFITAGHVHDRATLFLLNAFNEKNNSKITIASVEGGTSASEIKASEKEIKSLLHDMGLHADNFELKVVVNRLSYRGIKMCYDDHDLIVSGHDSLKHLRLLEQTLNDTTFAIVKRNPPLRFKSLAHFGVRFFFTVNKSFSNRFEIRPFQGYKLSWPNRPLIVLDHYLRLEERFDIETSDWINTFGLRFRYEAKLTLKFKGDWIPFNKRLFLPISMEVFGNLKGAQQFNDLVRISPGIGYEFSPVLKVELDFSYHYTRDTVEDDFDTNDFVFRFRAFHTIDLNNKNDYC